jgi:flagellar hook-length control protein FliK
MIDGNANDLVSREKNAPRNSGNRPAAAELIPARNLENQSFVLSEQQRKVLVDAKAQGLEETKEMPRISETHRRRAERPIIEIRDFRTGEIRPNNMPEAFNSTNTTLSRVERAIVVEIPIDLSLSETRELGGKTGEGSTSRNTMFQEALSQQLRENLGSDIVRQATIIARNGGEGTILLSLKPETLGNVKIRLEMAENKITGHIIVESSEALRAFERELPVLQKAFQDSGFSETSLDMFMAQDNGNQRPGQEENGDSTRLSSELAVTRYESETDRRDASEGIFSNTGTAERIAVNMLI